MNRIKVLTLEKLIFWGESEKSVLKKNKTKMVSVLLVLP